jgi:hypothetical protein
MRFIGFYAYDDENLNAFIEKGREMAKSQFNIFASDQKWFNIHIVGKTYGDRLIIFQTNNQLVFNPLYPALAASVILYAFFGLSWWLLLPLPLYLAAFLHSDYFLQILLKKGLKKKNYKKKIKFLKTDELLTEVLKYVAK